jgi:hypothetical protein
MTLKRYREIRLALVVRTNLLLPGYCTEETTEDKP